MKVAVIIAIALALSGVGALGIKSVSAIPGDPYNPYAPGLAHADIKGIPTDPYLGAPGQNFRGVPPNPVLPGASQLAPGILNQGGITVGHGGG